MVQNFERITKNNYIFGIKPYITFEKFETNIQIVYNLWETSK